MVFEKLHSVEVQQARLGVHYSVGSPSEDFKCPLKRVKSSHLHSNVVTTTLG
jgi:hypothetical protein